MGVRECSVDKLKENDVLATDVELSDYTLLLSAGTRLKRNLIEMLVSRGITSVKIQEGETAGLQEQAILKIEVQQKFTNQIRDIIEKHTYSHNAELKELVDQADELISGIMSEEDVMERVYDIRERTTDVYEHSVNVLSLSTLIGIRMGLTREQMHDIGVGALLHDLGLRYVGVEYQERYLDDMTALEKDEYKKHPLVAYQALKDETWLSEGSKQVILRHHERCDGSGFPSAAREVPFECSIVQVCDAFDELLCGICCRHEKIYEAIDYMKVNSVRKFDPRVVDVFLQFTAVYPVGTYVRLNTGEVAVVLHQNPGKPDRPIIRMVTDSSGKTITDEVRDMSKIRTIYIDDVEIPV
ncbi:MAG: HD domain-containing protein [Lachnospiraceae bacterium]|nr:HD domain-containing protein [Lachnospiraceae bacterium]